jgi:uncharacterized membrane protein YbhN (UPF0104 family)
MTKIEAVTADPAEDDIKPKTPRQRLWNIVKTVLKLAITAALLIWVFSKVDINGIIYRLLHPKYWVMYLAAIACFFLSMVVSAWRLMSFFKSMGLNLNRRYNLRLYFLGLLYNFLLPGGIGGDGYKMYLINKTYKTPLKKLFWAVMFDRLSGLWAIGFIVVVLIYLVPQININIFIPIGILIAGSFTYYFAARKFFTAYTKYFFQAHGKALLLQALQLLAIVCLIISQPDTGIEYPSYLLAFLMSGFAILIPATIGAVGAREGIFTLLSTKFPSIFHINPHLGVFLASSFNLIGLIVALLGLYYVIWPGRLRDGLPPGEKQTDN